MTVSWLSIMKRKRNWDNEYKSKRIRIFIAVRSLLWFYAIACESDLRGGSAIVGALFLRFALAIIPLYIYLKVRKVPMELSVEEGKKDFVCDGVWLWHHSASFV